MSDPRPAAKPALSFTAPFARTVIMGVLNVTPDSFSDGGRFRTPEDAIAHGKQLFTDGADLVDVGGESTRPGAVPVDPKTEQARVLAVIAGLTDAGIPVSIDTLHAQTARAAVEAGAVMINDVSGATFDPAMFETAAWASGEHGTALVLQHWRGVPDLENRRSHYDDVVHEVRDVLAQRAETALQVGVRPEHIVLDPGLGFDKTGEHSWLVLQQLHELQSLGYPVLVGTSRKRMMTEVLAAASGPALQTTAQERDLATSVTTALAELAGVWGVRVHDVAGSSQALAVARAWASGGASVRSTGDLKLDQRFAFKTQAASPNTATPAHANAVLRENGMLREKAELPEDRITLTGLEVFAHHGVFDFEREQGQRFILDVEVAVDLSAAAAGDALEQTVHYGELAEAVVAAVERDPVDLIETVAERVITIALGFPGVRQADVTVHKPDAPIDAKFSDVSVRMVRRASGRSHHEGNS